MLMRAVVNVVDNAIKYSPAGTTVALTVDVGADGALVLSVIDEGIGMTDETVRRLFEPFFQAERKPDGSGGVGLGLPFVKAVIERHGGKAAATLAEAGKGADAVIFGHTHILKYRQLREGKEYFNEGTWNETTNLGLERSGERRYLSFVETINRIRLHHG